MPMPPLGLMLWTFVYYALCVWSEQGERKDTILAYWANKTNAERHPECAGIMKAYWDTQLDDLFPAVMRCNIWSRDSSSVLPTSECMRAIARTSPYEWKTLPKKDQLLQYRCMMHQTANDELHPDVESSWYCRAVARRLLAN